MVNTALFNKFPVALITGGLSGIGFESALMLLERSIHVAAVSSKADQHIEAQSRLKDVGDRNGVKAIFFRLIFEIRTVFSMLYQRWLKSLVQLQSWLTQQGFIIMRQF